jgi:hypothetical protein
METQKRKEIPMSASILLKNAERTESLVFTHPIVMNSLDFSVLGA